MTITYNSPGTAKKTFGQKLNEGVGRGLEFGQLFMNKQAQEQAYKKLGLDPAIANLPPEAQAAYFKQAFAPQENEKSLNPLQLSQQALNEQKLAEMKKGEKPETALQKSQRELVEERLKNLQSQQSYFDKLMGNQENQNIDQKQQQSTQQQILELPAEDQKFLSQMPEENLNQLAAFAGQPGQPGIIGNIAKGELDKRENKRKINQHTFEANRDYHSGYSKKSEEEADQLRTSLPKKEAALNFARNSVETGDISYFSLDKLADITGIDLFRTAKGAQLLTAGKENLLSNLSRVSARAQNLWMEQKMSSMFPKIGQSKESNLTVQEMLEGEEMLDKAYLNSFDKLVNEDDQKLGYVRKDIKKRALEEIKPIEKQVGQRTAYRMKEIEEQEKGLQGLKKEVGKNVVRGTPLTMAMARLYKDKFGENALNVAEKNGYYIPSYEEFEIFQMTPPEFRQGVLE